MIKILSVSVASFILMEIASWAIHKYLMHGPLWNIHKTHHQKGKHFLELNDLFSATFGGLAIIALIVGLQTSNPYLIGSGIGVSAYGLLYFVLHDVLIHRRIAVGTRIRNPYLRGLANAHRDHHRTNQRKGAVSFGLLWVPLHYFKLRKEN